jgi:hypothetical protein
MYVVNFQLRWDNGDVKNLTCNHSEKTISDETYQWFLEAFTGSNTVELHLINITFSGEVVATFPNSLSNESVEVPWD